MDLIINEENIRSLPIQHFSVSSMLEYMKNEQSFFKKYVMLEFDYKTGPALIVGKAYHAALEYYYSNIRDNTKGEYSPQEYGKIKLFEEIEAVANLGLVELAAQKLTNEQQGQFVSLQNRTIDEILTDEEKKQDPLSAYESYKRILKDHQIRERELLKSFGITDEEINEAQKKYIEWGKTQTPFTAVQDLETALKNYFENLPGYTEILGIEESETVQICDLDGEVLPLPLKGIMDLITRDKDGNLIIVDHKCVSFFSDLNQTKAQYELQAGAYFFVAWAIFGERPKAMHFDECLKAEPKAIYPADPTRRLLQADLKELADQNGLQYDKYVKNEQLINMLLEAGVLEYTKNIQPIIINYEENPHVVTAFLKVYKIILNRLGIMALLDLPFEFLPNPFADYSGAESWDHFKAGLDITQSWKDTVKDKTELSENEEINSDFEL